MDRKFVIVLVGIIVLFVGGAIVAWQVLTPEIPEPPAPDNADALEPAVAEVFARLRQDVLNDPKSESAWLELGKAFDINDQLDQAMLCYNTAERIGFDDAELYFHRAIVLSRLDRLDEALADMKEAAKIATTFSPAHWRQGLFYLEQGKLTEAETAFRASIAANRNDSAGWVGLARVLLDQGKPEEAAEAIQQMLPTARTNVGYALQLLARAARAQGRDEEAQQLQLQAQALGPEPIWNDSWRVKLIPYNPTRATRLAMGREYLDMGDVNEAVKVLEKLAEEWSEEPAVGSNLAIAYGRQGRLEDSIVTAERVIAMHPNFAPARLNLATTLWSRLQTPGAVPESGHAVMRREILMHLDKALESNTGLAQAHALKGEVLASAGEIEQAASSYEQAVVHQPENVDWQFRAASLNFQLERYEEALAGYDAVISRAPAIAAAHYSRGLTLVRLGRIDEAEASFKRAIELDPTNEEYKSAITE